MNLVTQPHSKDAEQYVLGAMCLSINAINVARDRIDIEDFYFVNHQIIYKNILDLVDAKIPVDVLILNEELERKGVLEEVGGVDYLAKLVAYTASPASIEVFVKIVEEKALLRRLITTSEDIINLVHNSEDEVKDVLDRSEQLILSVVKKRQSSEFKNIFEILRDVKSNIDYLQTVDGNVTGTPTKFTMLDNITNGLHPNELIIIAARPAMGKTAFALNIAKNVALHTDKAVAVFSLEMGVEQLMGRLISSVGQIDANKLRTGKLVGKEWDQLNLAMAKLSKSKLYLDDSAGITVGEIRAKCRRLAAKEDLGLVVIDYLQLISASSKFGGANRQQEVSEISRMLKLMALELGVPVIALSQLSRGVESREDKRPLMSDLRESGSIEQDADLICFLYRDDYYNKESSNENQSLVEVIISKHRNGPTGKVELEFIKNYSLFTNIIKMGDSYE